MTKKEEAALRDELVRCRNRAREIRALLDPTPESEALLYLRNARGPCKGSEIATAIGKRNTHVSTQLSKAVKEGKAKRVGVGEYQAVSP